MKAVTYTRTGPARDVLQLTEVERPEPEAGEVRVRVRVSAVNPTDVKTRSGATPRPFRGIRIPHQDGVGEIDAVGEGVDQKRLGQRVWLWLAAPGGPGRPEVTEWGTAAQWTVVPEYQAVPLPADASDELGACLGVPGMTAHHCLFAGGSIAQSTVLVAGGAGAVGHYAVELGSWAGATVVATVSSPEKAGQARKAGADHVVNYRDPDAADQIKTVAPAGIHRFVEVALTENLDLDLAVAASGATIVTYAAGPKDPTIPVRACMSANLTLAFVLVYGVPRDELRKAAVDLTVAVSEGALTALPVHRFPLEDCAAAHEAVEAGVNGKVLVDVP
jgi:NADPH2:quinone reductase